MPKKIIAVIGATGAQGGNNERRCRARVRDICSIGCASF
jgi:hypothetical protein